MSSIYNVQIPTQPNLGTASYLNGNAQTDIVSSNTNAFVQFTSPINANAVTASLYGTASFAYGLPPNAYLGNPFTSSWAVNTQNVQTASYAMNISIKSLTVNMTAGASYGANSGPFTATITHNLGFKPSIIRWVLVATVTSGSLFSVGDEVDVFAANGPAPEQHQGGATIYTNTTTSRLYLFALNTSGQTSGTVILDRNNAQLAILNTQWQAKCYYSAF
jgi:hypothetical protein